MTLSLVLTCILALTLSIQGAPRQIEYSRITGETKNNKDNTVSLIAHVRGGNPAPNSFTWTLPDGSRLHPGRRSGSFNALAYTVSFDGSLKFVLNLANGYTSSPQSFTFRAEAVNRWWRAISFRLQAQKKQVRPVYSTLNGETRYNSDRSVRLQVTVTGGSPRPDKFQWTLPTGAIIAPGRSSGSFQATFPRRNSDGSYTYYLNLSNGLTTHSQSITFRAEATNRWWRTFVFTLPSKKSTIVNQQGSVQGLSHVSHNGRITIAAEIIEGTPKSTYYKWTVQQPDGSYINLSPGEGEASSIRINSRGNPTTTLTVTRLASRTRTFKLYASSETNGRRNWWASRTWTVSKTTH